MKYCPEYPSKGFATVDDARAWVARFVAWYNDVHLHSGIGFVTPSSRHAGDDVAILEQRRTTYQAARERQPARWARHTRPGTPEIVTLLPETDRISQDQDDQVEAEGAAA